MTGFVVAIPTLLYIVCSVLALYKMYGKKPRNSSANNMPKRIGKALPIIFDR